MKKFLSTLLMLTCVLGLTACGSEDAVSELQQSKVDAAKYKAGYVVEMTLSVVEQMDVDQILADYNNMELAQQFTAMYTESTQDTSFEAGPKAVRGAFSSFQDGMEAMGTVVEIGEPTATAKGDEIVVLVPITGENASGEVEILFSNDIFFEMSSCTLNIEESFSDLMTRAALNTLIGMAMVFVVLIIIIAIISAMSIIPKLQAKFAKKEEAEAAPVEATPVAVAPVVAEEELADDMELVAVIAAAIAAYEGTSTDGFRVRSIRRANTSKWKRA